MKQFNLAQALAGDPVVTRRGDDVIRLIHIPELTEKSEQVQYVIEQTYNYNTRHSVSIEGIYLHDDTHSVYDLMMKDRVWWYAILYDNVLNFPFITKMYKKKESLEEAILRETDSTLVKMICEKESEWTLT